MTDQTPELYDVEKALLQVSQMRLMPSEIVQAESRIGDQLAEHMRRHFPTLAEREAAGVALVVVAASIGGLCSDAALPMTTVPNIVGFAGQHLVGDARAEQAVVNHA